MVTASLPLSVSIRTPRPRRPLRERVSVGGAAALSVLGVIALIAIAAIGALIVPLAALIVFGPTLLSLI